MTGHSIQKLRVFAPPNSWVIVFMGLITTRLKILSSIQGIQDIFILFFSVFSTSFHCMGQNNVNVQFSYYGRSTVVLRYEMSRSVFTNSSVPTHKRLLIQQLLTSNAANNFRHRISSFASKLSTQNKD